MYSAACAVDHWKMSACMCKELHELIMLLSSCSSLNVCLYVGFEYLYPAASNMEAIFREGSASVADADVISRRPDVAMMIWDGTVPSDRDDSAVHMQLLSSQAESISMRSVEAATVCRPGL